jgi:Amino acid permease
VALYFAMNVAIIGVIPWREAMRSQYVVSDLIARLHHGRAASVMTVLILVTTLAGLFAGMLGISRIPYAAAADGRFFHVFARLHSTKHFPSFSVLFVACSNSMTSPTTSDTTSTPPPTTPSGTMPTATIATLNVMLKDGPFVDAKALLITFSNVSAHLSGGDFTPLPFVGGASSRTRDLERLTTAQDGLGTGLLPEGHYGIL